MQLFHYHYWTPFVEETEQAYRSLGFEVKGRFTKSGSFHPPLTWEDFREEQPTFRIIEMRKGQINITFGYSKKVLFDHIGFLVSDEEYAQLLAQAKELNWPIQAGERRTFLSTPLRLRLELQRRTDVIETGTDALHAMTIAVPDLSQTPKVDQLLSPLHQPIHWQKGEQLSLLNVIMTDDDGVDTTDPNGVHIVKQT
ncbi:hypothetical protein ABE33_02540 [Bacillus safensis]|uniref:Glyoxalase-like domain-containing protein n=2 Tax=Bacillus safensis TaxID=561879 RepID=A0A5C0WE88_BACIA|nr:MULTISPECIES: hypothetical protein [Bacillus]MBG9824222.1 hypothetical protein [Bacillus safensis]MBG9832838.1 hypothetical protein [Bacillus safensis]MBG9859934.1 hypothetical protein [Bacillus safensis]MBG9897535.1 hypothetical protein [Bacillus safensis]MCM3368001.1 hypothetical protein [Bacillus safensis]